MPTGCTEQQGPHLPVWFDSWLVETIACAAAEEATRAYGICVLVLPMLPFGPTPDHRGFGGGYIDIPRDLHEAIVGHVLRSLVDQGFRRMVIWRGCGGQIYGRPSTSSTSNAQVERTPSCRICRTTQFGAASAIRQIPAVMLTHSPLRWRCTCGPRWYAAT